MGTPTLVRFSRAPGLRASVVGRLAKGAFDALGIRPRGVVRLQPSQDPYDGGLAVASEEISCTSFNQVAQALHGEAPMGVVCEAPCVPGYVYIYTFGVTGSGFSVATTVDPSLVGWARLDGEPGEWFQELLTRMVADLDVDVAGYGSDPEYDLKYEDLDPQELVSRLMSGDLLEIWYPTYHAFKRGLVPAATIEKLMRSRRRSLATADLRYEQVVVGYHVLSILP